MHFGRRRCQRGDLERAALHGVHRRTVMNSHSGDCRLRCGATMPRLRFHGCSPGERRGRTWLGALYDATTWGLYPRPLGSRATVQPYPGLWLPLVWSGAHEVARLQANPWDGEAAAGRGLRTTGTAAHRVVPPPPLQPRNRATVLGRGCLGRWASRLGLHGCTVAGMGGADHSGLHHPGYAVCQYPYPCATPQPCNRACLDVVSGLHGCTPGAGAWVKAGAVLV
jgi:hypothetical protein